MDFGWKSQTDEGESPGSSSSDAFYDYAAVAAAARANGEDTDVYNALFANGSNGDSSNGLSTETGLTSLDFWSMEDVKPMHRQFGNPDHAQSQQQEQQEQAKQESRSTPTDMDAVEAARRSMFQDRFASLSSNANTPDAIMAFEDFVSSSAYGDTPTSGQAQSDFTASSFANVGSNANIGYSASDTGFPSSSSLFGNISSNPSSTYATPEVGLTGINLQEVLASPPPIQHPGSFAAFSIPSGSSSSTPANPALNMSGAYPHSNASSPPMSPETLLRTLSSSTSEQHTSGDSSRSSSHDPPTYQPPQRAPNRLPDRSQYATATPSTSSSSRTHTARNSPPSTMSDLHMTKSSGSLPSSSAPKPGMALLSMPQQAALAGKTVAAQPNAVASGSKDSTMGSPPLPATDKAGQAMQMQPYDSSAYIKRVVRDAPAKPPQYQMLILGLPEEGARSRVETQVKVGLTLLRPRGDSASDGKGGPRAMSYKDAKGALTPEADAHFERVGAWKFLALPAVCAVKRKAKKHHRANVPPEQTLFADIKVVSATNPGKEIFICQNCQQRELKRLQRKTQNRSKPSQDLDSGKEDELEMTDVHLAGKKIVLFNCGQYLDFDSGQVVVPTRITCYCRHHKEKYGFNVVFSLTDHLGNAIASAMTPAIFLTDDHKARPTKPDSVDFQHLTSLEEVANGTSHSRSHSRSGSAWASGVSSAASSQASSQVSSAANSARPSRSNSMENLENLGMAESQAVKTRREQRSGKPYNLENRPTKVKRNSSMNRLNSFAMTPLTRSQPGSPRHGAVSPPPSMQALPPDYLQQANEPLMDYLKSSEFSAAIETHPSPGSSLSAPSTPGASFDSYGSSWPNNFSTWANNAPGGQPDIAASGSVTSGEDFLPGGLRSVEQSPAFAGFVNLPNQQALPGNLSQSLSSLDVNDARLQTQQLYQEQPPVPQPKISRLIPSEGPTHGGVEVIILGENFTPGLEVIFGESPAISTQAWGGNTLVCTLPPSPSPGPVVVGFKGLSSNIGSGASLQLFTYLDTSDKALMELALQVVGMKMTGRIDDARNVARRIIGTKDGSPGQMPSPISPVSTSAPFMQTVNGAGQKPRSSAALQEQLMAMGDNGQTRDFQAIILKLLSLYDVEYSSMEEQDSAEPEEIPIDHQNEQHHTLLHLAALLGFHRLVDFLIQRNASLDAQDKHGYTALHLAALCGRVTAARLLIEAGAAMFKTTKAGHTAHQIARERDQPDVQAVFPLGVRLQMSSNAQLACDSPMSPISLCRSPRSPRRKGMFSLGKGSTASETSASDAEVDVDADVDSDWSSSDGEQPLYASESEIETQLSRIASRVSVQRGILQSPVTTPPAEVDGHAPFAFDGTNAADVQSREASGSGVETWLPRLPRVGILSKFKLPSPLSLASWRPSTATSSSMSTASSATSDPSGLEESEDEPQYWPASLGHGKSTNGKVALAPAAGAPSQLINRSEPSNTVKANLARRLGYSIDNLTEDALRSYSFHAQNFDTLRKDKMLYFFWLPLFVMAMIWVSLQASNIVSFTFSLLAPSSAQQADTIKA